MNKPNIYMICEDTYSAKPQIISTNSEIKKNKSVKFNQTLQDADVENRNRRIYRKKGLQEGLLRENVQELIRRKSWYGEAGHPIDPSQARQLTIDPKLISHRVNKVWWDSNLIKGQLETALTPFGYQLKDLITEQDMEMAVSLRAIGNITVESGKTIVGSPMQLVCYDWVFYPSHRTAYKDSGLVTESANSHGNSMVLTESVLIPLNAQESKVLSYIKDQSVNYKIVSELFGGYTNVELSKDNKKIILEMGNDKAIIPVEKYISDEVDHYLNKL